MSLQELNVRYATLRSTYDEMIRTALDDPSKLAEAVPKIESVNQEMVSVLDEMLKTLQYTRETPESDTYRDELVEILTRIQMDYNGLKANTDKLETLRRIRAFQDTSWKSTLSIYLALLILAAIVLVLVILFRRQKNTSTPIPTTSATAIPTLT